MRQSGLSGSQPSHLTNALQLAGSVLQRFYRDRHNISAEDLAALDELLRLRSELRAGEDQNTTTREGNPSDDAFPLATPPVEDPKTTLAATTTTTPPVSPGLGPAVPPDAATETTRTNSAPQLPRRNSRTAMMSKIKEVLNAPKVYRQMIDTKADMSSLVQFSVKCSTASASLLALCDILKKEVIAMIDHSDVKIFVRDGTSPQYFINMLDSELVDSSAARGSAIAKVVLAQKLAEAASGSDAAAAVAVCEANVLAVPFIVDQQVVGCVTVGDVKSL